MLSAVAANADSYDYDATGRLVKATFADGSSISYQYDNAGNIVGKITATGARLHPAVDINSNSSPDFAVLRTDAIRAEIRDGGSAALLREITFLSNGFTRVAAASLPDTDGNGVSELAVLAIRNSDGRMVTEIRNITGPEQPRLIWFAANHTPIGLAVIDDDADGNGVPEIAVLSTRDSDARGLVEVKNAFGPTATNAVWVAAGFTPMDLAVVPDADGNGVPEVAVLSTRDSDKRIVVEVKNAAGPTNPNLVWFMPGNTPIDLTVVADKDSNGIPEVAVLSSRNSDGRNVVESKNAAGATSPTAVWFAAGHAALQVEAIGDADNNGVPEVAVLSARNEDGRILVEVKNTFGPTSPNAIWYPPGFTALGMTVFADADGNGVDEAGVLLLRNSDQRLLVQGRNASGSFSPTDYWLSP